jgi:hypothetical protein
MSVRSGGSDCDDRERAADALMRAARAAEPSISKTVKAVAVEVGGSLERFVTRLKSRESVVEKLERFRKRKSPHYRLDRFNDTLRYTIVNDTDYWRTTQQALAVFEARGFTVKYAPRGWAKHGYKGLNVTLRARSGFEFEVQFHTEASLAAAEKTHRLYEIERKFPHGSEEQKQLKAAQGEEWGKVPFPPSVPRIG